jgi:hypothetical protein
MSFWEIVCLLVIAGLIVPVSIGLSVNLFMENYYSSLIKHQERLYEIATKFRGLDNGPKP